MAVGRLYVAVGRLYVAVGRLYVAVRRLYMETVEKEEEKPVLFIYIEIESDCK